MDFDHSTREIYMPLAAHGLGLAAAAGGITPPEALLLVDFDTSNAGQLSPL